MRTQGNPGLVPVHHGPRPAGRRRGVPADCTPSHQTLFIPNVTTDVGLSPPYNSMFTFFGQFFDHGVDQTVKGGGTLVVTVTASPSTVAWTASDNASWLTVESASGSGSGSVTLTAANAGKKSRSATATIGGQTVSVTQAGR